ncbi:hypothetical protein EAG_09879 [Camponotus floridanus]|uniref:Uncharacterized protein n=1 Tax=Camponotus floridanus TaxID=104421 RepID=E2A6A5_CAMFO|nr:hypothetical protein EAG_09879 [Camponotus floridanus]
MPDIRGTARKINLFCPKHGNGKTLGGIGCHPSNRQWCCQRGCIGQRESLVCATDPRVGEGGDDPSRGGLAKGGGVGGFGALPRREHPPARELYCDHRYHTTVPPRLVLVKQDDRGREEDEAPGCGVEGPHGRHPPESPREGTAAPPRR